MNDQTLDNAETETDRPIRSLLTDEQGSTSLEWALLLAGIGIPAWYVIQSCIEGLTGHYQMMTMINSLPFP